MQSLRLLLVLASLLIALLAGPVTARADDVEDFYRDKMVSLYVGYPPGGGYDVYARLLAKYMPKHLAGHPSFLVRNRPGAASLTLVNDLYNVLPRDGTVFGMFARSIAMDKLLGRQGAQYDPVRLNWIGSANNEVSICAVWHGLGVKSLADFMQRPIVFGANAPGSEAERYPTILNNLLGAHFKIVTCYPGVIDLLLAMERGETQGRCGWTWSAAKVTKADWLREKKIDIVLQFAIAKHPELPNVPLVTELARNDKERQALDLILTMQAMGRPFAAPHDVPADRVAALRAAFSATLRDPDFTAEANAKKLEIELVEGAALQDMVVHMFQAPKDVVEAARTAIGHH
jgi:tripartite-type tricarboxylate transporter receptor subunit TctC